MLCNRKFILRNLIVFGKIRVIIVFLANRLISLISQLHAMAINTVNSQALSYSILEANPASPDKSDRCLSWGWNQIWLCRSKRP